MTTPNAKLSPPPQTVIICLLLALGTLALYWPVTHFPFIGFDDDDYITDNPVTKAGLTWHGIVWAFNGPHAANWHPLTWMSHMLDCQLFGLNAGGHHLVNVLFHIANTLLLFAFLRYTTGKPWRSAAVAALFAWHPLHVESVAWIAERKDVLSAFFWLLTLLAYTRYARGGRPGNSAVTPAPDRHRKTFYGLSLLSCACAMLSKPMAVTLPFVLLLLDLWPLQRISGFRIGNSKFPVRLLVEKIPFFVLSLTASALTFLAQRGGGAVSPVEWSSRLGNVPVAYARYLSKLFWPTDLAIIYPYVYHWPAAAIAGSVLLLLLLSALALVLVRPRPWLAAGWFWFLGTLVPVIGFVQVGAQSMADRYTYIPSIGLFIVVVWGVSEYCAARPNGNLLLALLGGSVLAGCVLATSIQINYWRNTANLFFHALQVTTKNYVADNALGKALENAGQYESARELYQDAVNIEPRYAVSQFNLGICLLEMGRKSDALPHLAAAAQLAPDNADAQFNLGVFFAQDHQWTEAARCFDATLKLRPDSAAAHFHLGEVLVQLGQPSKAAAEFHEALRLQPGFPGAKRALDELPTRPPAPEPAS